ncbi:MAG TPA: hypothetical protein VJY33_26375, partial [Isosphaeraceae bacterium]|nr:hypothetical protein [Isosphaeraceae bacterium]
MLLHRAAVLFVLLGALLLSGRGPAADQTELKIEDLERAPFPSHLVAAPARGRIAWVFNDRGVRNIWIAESPDYKGKQVTSHTTDDGQEITGLAWAPDGGALVYVKGNDAHNGRHINPRSKPKPPPQIVCALLLDGMKAREVQLGEGHSPAPSGSNRVAFIHKGQIWSAPLDGSSKSELLIDAPGDCSQLRWSPQGAEADLAFVNKRGEHSFVGVYHSANQSIR